MNIRFVVSFVFATLLATAVSAQTIHAQSSAASAEGGRPKTAATHSAASGAQNGGYTHGQYLHGVQPAGAYDNRQAPSSFRHHEEAPLVGGDSFFDQYIAKRLSIGLTISTWKLTDDSRSKNDTYLGNITQLDEDKSTYIWPEIEYEFWQYARAEFSWYEIQTTTLNWNNHQGDGRPSESGPYVGLKFQYPLLDGMVKPFAGIGVAFLKSDFDYYSWWRYDYSSPADYAAAGSPTHSSKMRAISVDDATTVVYSFGVTAEPIRHLELAAFMRYAKIDADCAFGYDYGDGMHVRQTGTFVFDNYMYGLAARYAF